MDTTLSKLFTMLWDLMERLFYGKIVISVEAGKIVNIRK
jgi:hypothetical protein